MVNAAPPFAASGVLVAGGTSGIGLASALAFVDAGVRKVVLLGRSPGRGALAAAEVRAAAANVDVAFESADATNPAAVERAVANAHAAMGSIDVAVTSVSAPFVPELLHDVPLSSIGPILSGHALPAMLVTRAVWPYMCEQGSGSIVNVASDAAKVATPGETVVGAAMAAIVGFSQAAALEGKRRGVRVNAVTPSLVEGTLTTDRVTREGFSQKLFVKARERAHLGVPDATDLAALVAFLGGPHAGRLTGQAISVNGGISAA